LNGLVAGFTISALRDEWAFRVALIAIGAVLVAFFPIVLLTESGSTKTVTEVSDSNTESIAAGTGTTTTGTNSTTADPTSTSLAEPSRGKTHSNKTTTTTSPKPNRSEALLAGLLAAGAVLVLAGAFFDRIKSVKVGGTEITLRDDQAAALSAQMAKKTTPGMQDEERLKAAFLLAARKVPPTSSGDDPVYDYAANYGLRSVGYNPDLE
jgi:hypothetical protein